MKTVSYIIFIIIIAAFTVSCNTSRQEHQTATSHEAGADITKAVCILYPTEGNSAAGMITFRKEENGIRITGEVTGLNQGRKGMHIHEYGDCSASDASTAGDHFNPFRKLHGSPSDTSRHTGDLGNINVSMQGTASIDMIDTLISFSGEGSIIGRSLVVHAGEDDLNTQPSGNSGSRVACGVIGIAK